MPPSPALFCDLRVWEAALDNPERTVPLPVVVAQRTEMRRSFRWVRAVLRFPFTEPSRMFATRESERLRLAGPKLDSEATARMRRTSDREARRRGGWAQACGTVFMVPVLAGS